MAHIEKQRGKYRARYSDPGGNVQSRTFARKTDAERFLRQVDADRVRGQWVDPRNADTPLAAWAEEFLSLCLRLSPTTQETYRRDLDKYVLPRFGAYRLGQLPADEIENWLNDEIVAGIAPFRFYVAVDTGWRAFSHHSPFTASLLAAHLESFARPGPDALVFANAAGNPLTASSFLTHHFSKAQVAAGVSCRFHDLRHTSVALAIAAGAHPQAIQSRMGHSSINVTVDRYGHLFPELDEA